MRSLLPETIASLLKRLERRVDLLERISPAGPPSVPSLVSNVMTTPGDMIYEDLTPTPARLPIGNAGQVLTVTSGAVENSSATGDVEIVPNGAGQNDEHVISGMDLQFAAGVPSKVIVYWNLWTSANGFGQPKQYRIRLRRTNLTGTVLWDLVQGAYLDPDDSSGHIHQSQYSYLDDAPSDGHYVMTIQADPAATFDQSLWSDTRTMLIGDAAGAETPIGTSLVTLESDNSEHLVTGMDVTAPVLPTLYVGTRIKYSTQVGSTSITWRIRRTSITGAILATLTNVNGLADSTGLYDLMELGFVDSAPTDGHYVVTIQSADATHATYSAYRHLWVEGASGQLPAWMDDVDTYLVDPTTTEGDMLYRHSGAVTRLPVGGSNTLLHGGTDPAYSAVVEGDLSLSDVTTDDVSTTKHGFAPKAPNDTTKFLRGDATWDVPPADTALHWSLLTNGDPATPELVFDAGGDVILVPV